MKKTMSKTTPVRLAELLLTAATLLVAALLIIQCADAFFTGTAAQNLSETGVYIQPIYSREIVAERLARIAWAFVLWLVALIVALIVREVKPHDRREPLRLSAENRLALMRRRVTPSPEMLGEQSKRRTAGIACAAVCGVCAVFAGVYMLDMQHFASRDLEVVMGKMMLHVTPWIAVAFAALMVFAQVREASMERELEAAKTAPKRKPEPQTAQKSPLVPVGQIALYVAAIIMLIAGIMNGGMYDVLVKAINICTECIGLG